MTSLSTALICSQIGAQVEGRQTAGIIEHLLIDSRKLVFPETSLFFSIKTEKRDGHDFIPDLYRRGVRNFVISDLVNLDQFPDAQFLLVKDGVDALQQIASAHRKQFHYPVIGITGSNGKTIVKEWLFHLLHDEFNIVRSPRSYNSQLGVPLSVWQMDESHELGLFEAGISCRGEMEKLQMVIQPTIGLITNIGAAHSEGFDTIQEKLDEKLKLFSGLKYLVYCKDLDLLDKSIKSRLNWNEGLQIISWGRSPEAFIQIQSMNVVHRKMQIELGYENRKVFIELPFIDHAAVENAMHCIAIAVVLGKLDEVVAGMQDLPSQSMRLEMKQGQQDCVIINDTYNADLNGLLTALEFLGMQSDSRKKAVILSDVAGISGEAEQTYALIADHLLQNKVGRLIGIGEHFKQFGSEFEKRGIETALFSSTEDFIRSFLLSEFRNETILIKGVRHSKMERISRLLESKTHQTRLEIDLSAISHNLHEYRKQIRKGTGIMAMVKAFSYGAGSYEIANLLQFHKVEYLAVAYVDEGIELRRAGISMPIMVMNTEQTGFSELVEYDLEPEIYSIEIAEAFNDYLLKQGLNFFPVHIKLDTGMHRLGFDETSIVDLMSMISSSSSMKVQSVFTHLVASEDEQHDIYTKKQASLFESICESISQSLGYTFYRHAANTAAIRRFPQLHYEMVRLGIGLYGVDPGGTDIDLIESATLKSTIAQIKHVKAGDSVGYGRKAIMLNDTRIATIRIGYADGFPRSLGNGKGEVIIKGHFIKTVGNICMDMTMVDITAYPDIELNEEVIILGKGLPVRKIAEEAGTIAYEIMTGISQRVPRVYYGEI
jgi:alanine racemase